MYDLSFWFGVWWFTSGQLGYTWSNYCNSHSSWCPLVTPLTIVYYSYKYHKPQLLELCSPTLIVPTDLHSEAGLFRRDSSPRREGPWSQIPQRSMGWFRRENFNRKTPYLMGKSMVSCEFSRENQSIEKDYFFHPQLFGFAARVAHVGANVTCERHWLGTAILGGRGKYQLTFHVSKP